MDVTLCCEGGDSRMQAHRVVLAACSPLLRKILARAGLHQAPLLYLKGVDATNLSAVLDFMYNGEVNVAQEQLPAFLRAAEELAVKGLTDKKEEEEGEEEEEVDVDVETKVDVKDPGKENRKRSKPSPPLANKKRKAERSSPLQPTTTTTTGTTTTTAGTVKAESKVPGVVEAAADPIGEGLSVDDVDRGGGDMEGEYGGGGGGGGGGGFGEYDAGEGEYYMGPGTAATEQGEMVVGHLDGGKGKMQQT